MTNELLGKFDAAYKPIKIKVDGKNRIIKDIRENKEESFWALYKKYEIFIDKEPDEFLYKDVFYARVHHPNGELIVDGWMANNFDDCLRICMENILYKE